MPAPFTSGDSFIYSFIHSLTQEQYSVSKIMVNVEDIGKSREISLREEREKKTVIKIEFCRF